MGRMEPAQPLTVSVLDFRFLLLRFVLEVSAASESEPLSEDDTVCMREAESEELELIGRDRVDVFEGPNDSRPKNDQRFDALVGLGGEGLTAVDSATPTSAGIEFRRRGEVFVAPVLAFATDSKMAPAVDGRDSPSSLVGLRESGAAGAYSSVKETGETTEEMLSDMPCPGRAVTVLDVSLDTSDSGRGINSSVSEKPTRALVVGLGFGLGGTETSDSCGVSAGAGVS